MEYKIGDKVFIKNNWLSSYGRYATIINTHGDNFYTVKYENGCKEFVGSKLIAFKLDDDKDNTLHNIAKEYAEGYKQMEDEAFNTTISFLSDNSITFNKTDISIEEDCNIKNSIIELLEDTLNSSKEIKSCKHAPCSICEYNDVGLYCEDEHTFKWKYEDKAVELLKKLKGD